MNRFSKIKYTYNHRRQFIKWERILCEKNTIRGLFHDMDKYILILIFGNKSSKIHRKFSKHHDRASSRNDYIQMIIDWECARFTKTDKPLNARETLIRYYPRLKNEILPIINELGI